MWYQNFFKMKKKNFFDFFINFFIFSLKVISNFFLILKNTLRGPVNGTLKTIVVSLNVFYCKKKK